MMRAIILQVVVFVALLCAVVCPANSAIAQEKHSDPSRSCTAGQCHAAVVKHKYLHGPLLVGQCVVCHSPLSGNQHKFAITGTDAKLCARCHQPVNTEAVLHDPVSKGHCLKCHDPHGSEEQSQIRKSPASALCADCHKAVVTRKYTHRPAARGECLTCHRAHGSKSQNLLDASGSALCLKCHENMRQPAAGSGKQKIHLASENCANCHRAHDSDYQALLARPPIELCFRCHKELREKTELSEFKHDALSKGQGCVGCHRAHNSKLDNLLRQPAADLCFTCHEDFQARIDASKFKHRPAADKSCGSCHVPHSSKYKNLLSAGFPPGAQSAYDPARYAFCFSCHEETIAGDRYTDKLTDFRNGRFNLHYLHVNEGGQTCLTCHAGHAGSQPADIREEVPFGSWKIPVKFTRSKTGGSCITGCHKEHTYDRANPVQLSAQ